MNFLFFFAKSRYARKRYRNWLHRGRQFGPRFKKRKISWVLGRATTRDHFLLFTVTNEAGKCEVEAHPHRRLFAYIPASYLFYFFLLLFRKLGGESSWLREPQARNQEARASDIINGVLRRSVNWLGFYYIPVLSFSLVKAGLRSPRIINWHFVSPTKRDLDRNRNFSPAAIFFGKQVRAEGLSPIGCLKSKHLRYMNRYRHSFTFVFVKIPRLLTTTAALLIDKKWIGALIDSRD